MYMLYFHSTRQFNTLQLPLQIVLGFQHFRALATFFITGVNIVACEHSWARLPVMNVVNVTQAHKHYGH